MDNNTGRFISRDPIKDGYNWYAYCAGNPISYVDPTGLVMKSVETGPNDTAPADYQSTDSLKIVNNSTINGNSLIHLGGDNYVLPVGPGTGKNQTTEKATNSGVKNNSSSKSSNSNVSKQSSVTNFLDNLFKNSIIGGGYKGKGTASGEEQSGTTSDNIVNNENTGPESPHNGPDPDVIKQKKREYQEQLANSSRPDADRQLGSQPYRGERDSQKSMVTGNGEPSYDLVNASWDYEYPMSARGKSEDDLDITDDFLERLIKAANEMESYGNWKDWFAAPWTVPNKMMKKRILGLLENLNDDDYREIIKGNIHKDLQRTPYKFKRFYDKVKTRGDWDVKNRVYKKYFDSGVVISGRKYKLDVTGNFMYGYAGAAAGFSFEVLAGMAGLAQKNSDIGGNGKTERTIDSYYDDPRDQLQIYMGVILYQTYGTNIDADMLGAFMRYLEED